MNTELRAGLIVLAVGSGRRDATRGCDPREQLGELSGGVGCHTDCKTGMYSQTVLLRSASACLVGVMAWLQWGLLVLVVFDNRHSGRMRPSTGGRLTGMQASAFWGMKWWTTPRDSCLLTCRDAIIAL